MSPARVFWALAAVLFPIAMAGPTLLHRVLGARERALFDNAVWRAVEAANRGDLPVARREAALALVPPHERVELWDDSPRFGLLPGVVESRLELARSLAARGLDEEARLAAWAALRAYHAEPRPSLDPRPWRLIHDAAPEASALRSAAARVLALQSGAQPPAAAEPAIGASVSAGRQALELGRLERVSNGYARPDPLSRGPARRLRAGMAVSLAFHQEAPAASLEVRATGNAVLGLPPILLVSLDRAEPYPLLLEPAERQAFHVPGTLAAGPHVVRLELLNGYRLRAGDERDVELSGLALVPRDQPPRTAARLP